MRPPLLITAGALLMFTACAPSPPATVQTSQPGQPFSRSGGTLRVAWLLEPETLAPKFLAGSGTPEYLWLFSSFLTQLDAGGVSHPLLAREIPTQENGGWVVNLDGTMITTYRLRPQAKWHDGTPLTAQDFVFAFEVFTDKELPVLRPSPEPLMERVDAQDDQTVVIRWKEPYVNANHLGLEQLPPLPRHVLEAKYRTNKASFATGPEWTTAYISTGPFKVDRWTPGVGMVAVANMDFVLGPPKLDAIDIRFIPDPNVQVANLLSGEVDLINPPGVRAREAVIARDYWGASGEGYVKAWSTNAQYIEWQFREVPNWQQAIADIRVRQALLHAIDREGLNESINLGFTPLAHAFVSPQDPLFPDIDRVTAKYPYDRNRAATLLAEAGWRQPAGSGLVTNAAGKTLDAELFTTVNQEQPATILVDNWKAAGVNATLFVVPQARARDGELTSNFTAARVNNRQIGQETFVWTASEFPTPENRWLGGNSGGFFDPEVDRLQTLRVTSLDENQRRHTVIALIKRMTDLAGPTPLLYAAEVLVARKNVVGPVGKVNEQNGFNWNVYEWEIIH